MKTVEEWLATLPEPYRARALANLRTSPRSSGVASATTPALHWAVNDAFTWDGTQEGGDYWNDVYYRAQRNEFDKQDIDCTIPEGEAT